MSTISIEPHSRLYVESDMLVPELVEIAHGSAALLCRRCPGKFEPNDDSAAIVQTVSGAVVLIVADGVGGGPLGYKASSIAVQCVAESVQRAEPNSDLRPAILDGIELANREILDTGIGAATTLSVVEIQDKVARAYQVGDSMTLLIGGRGMLKWKSTSHSPVGYAVESGFLNEIDAMKHDDRHLVSNLVGCPNMHIEIGPSRLLSARDSIVVGSDGLFDNLHLAEVIERAKSGKLLHRIKSLASLAAERMGKSTCDVPGKPDDLTIVIYKP
jgi:PPM family protein phosphatase